MAATARVLWLCACSSVSLAFIADFRSVNTFGVVKRQSSQVTSHDLAIAVCLLLQSTTSSIDHFTVVCLAQLGDLAIEWQRGCR